jgi:hypothetical protein
VRCAFFYGVTLGHGTIPERIAYARAIVLHAARRSARIAAGLSKHVTVHTCGTVLPARGF